MPEIGTGSDPDVPAWIKPDGTWRLVPAHGRAAKEHAQFIGATARAQERARRLALIDAALANQQAAREQAEQSHSAPPSPSWTAGLRRCRPAGAAAGLDTPRGAPRGRGARGARAQEAAHAARVAAAEARARLERLAAEQDLPADRERLDAVEQELRCLDEDLREATRQDKPIRGSLTHWQEAVAELKSANAALATEQEAAAEATQGASAPQAALGRCAPPSATPSRSWSTRSAR